MIQKVTRFGFVLMVGLMCLPPRSAEAAPGPSDVVRNFYGELLNVMQNAAALGVKGRYQKLEPLVLTTFEVPFMTRLSVGPSWAGLPAEQKQGASQAFGRYIAATYATRFDDFSGEQFQILGEQQVEHGTIVKTQLVKADGEKVIINYAVHDNDTSWQIRDVYLAGTISELATRRSDFTSTLRSGGIEALILRLNKKVDDLVG